jgi:hypothetical protein
MSQPVSKQTQPAATLQDAGTVEEGPGGPQDEERNLIRVPNMIEMAEETKNKREQ